MPSSRPTAKAAAIALGLALALAGRARAEETSASAPPPAGESVATSTPAPSTLAAAMLSPGPTADTPTVAAGAPAAAGSVMPAPPPPPYSLPWQLRPVTVGNVLRSDTSVAFYDNAMGSGSTVATMLLGSYKLTPNLAPLVRLGFVENGPPGTAPDGKSFVNPVLGATYSAKIPGGFRLAGFVGATVPIGMGGGSVPDIGAAGANKGGIAARSGMDNAMFAVNYLTAILGGGFAYIDHKLTIQVEATVFQLFRVKGNDTTGISSDSTRTNSTMGIHAGYFLLPVLSLGGEARYQRWLSTPTQVAMGTRSNIASASMDTVSVAVGPRFHFKVGDTWLRPGISYAQVLDSPLSDAHYKMVQVDIPVVF